MKDLFELYKVLGKVKPDVAKIAKAYLDEYIQTETPEAKHQHLYWMGFLEELQHNLNLIEEGEWVTLQQFQERAAVALWHMGGKVGPVVEGRINMLHLIKDFEPIGGE